MADEDADAVLSDVDGDDDPSPLVLSAGPAYSSDEISPDRLRDLHADLDRERQARKAADNELSDLQNKFNRLKVLAHEAIKKRDEALRENEESLRSGNQVTAELAEALRLKDDALKEKDDALREKEDALKEKEDALREKDDALKQKDSSRSEIESVAQMLVSGIEKISGKVSKFKNFSASGGGGLPRPQKHTGLQAVAYGVIKRTNEIVEELIRQIEVATKSRNEAREQMEQRNYEIAIEVSQLEATISGLREDVSKKGLEIENLEKLVADRDTRISLFETEMEELRQIGDEYREKSKALQAKLDSQRPLVIDQLNYLSRVHEQISEIIKHADIRKTEQSDISDSFFMSKEVDMDENLRTSLEGTMSVYELVKVATEKVREGMDESNCKMEVLNERVAQLLAEKQHVGTLLRSALSSKTIEVREVAENGLREAGIDFKFSRPSRQDAADGDVDEVYTLAGALENTVKESQLEIIELQHLVEALRAESSLLKANLEVQAKEIGQQKRRIRELEEKEQVANENVEGLMTDIAAAEEEISRWRVAAEQEAAAGRAVEKEFEVQLSVVRRELEEAKQALLESEHKLKFKEEIATAAMAARDTAEKSLRLADVRSSKLRERLEELTRQLEELDNREDSSIRNRHRYVCWPWEWLGLNFVRYQADVQETTNEMELSEPLM